MYIGQCHCCAKLKARALPCRRHATLREVRNELEGLQLDHYGLNALSVQYGELVVLTIMDRVSNFVVLHGNTQHQLARDKDGSGVGVDTIFWLLSEMAWR